MSWKICHATFVHICGKYWLILQNFFTCALRGTFALRLLLRSATRLTCVRNITLWSSIFTLKSVFAPKVWWHVFFVFLTHGELSILIQEVWYHLCQAYVTPVSFSAQLYFVLSHNVAVLNQLQFQVYVGLYLTLCVLYLLVSLLLPALAFTCKDLVWNATLNYEKIFLRVPHRNIMKFICAINSYKPSPFLSSMAMGRDAIQ